MVPLDLSLSIRVPFQKRGAVILRVPYAQKHGTGFSDSYFYYSSSYWRQFQNGGKDDHQGKGRMALWWKALQNKKGSDGSTEASGVLMLSLKRFAYHPLGTLGVIDISFEGGEERFWTIERPWRDNERNVSCIPEGEYPLEWRESPRFGMSWHVDDVPNRSHILLHVANYPTDVQGCIGLGTDLLGNNIAVAKSRAAMERFEAITRGYHWRLQIKFASNAAVKSP